MKKFVGNYLLIFSICALIAVFFIPILAFEYKVSVIVHSIEIAAVVAVIITVLKETLGPNFQKK